MKMRITGIVLAAVFIATVFAGCGTGAKTANETMQAVTAASGSMDTYGGEVRSSIGSEPAKADLSAAAGEQPSEEKGSATALASGGDNIAQDVSNAILAERKVIRSANISVEVKDFDKAYGEINTFILNIGFVQSTSINSEKYYVDNLEKMVRHGTIVIRVEKDRFDKVLNSLKGIGTVLSWNLDGEDVTDKYYDTESRLRLLRIEESKLEEYLKKLSDLDQIFKTESRLTDIRYQIEALTGTLKKMSDLVELSTITINISEKYPESVKPSKPKTYGQRLLDNFLDSMKGVASFVGEFIIIIVAAIPILVLLGLFALLAVFIYRKIPRKKPHIDEKRDIDTEHKDNTTGN